MTARDDKSSRFDVLNEVHQRLHDMKNLQRASAWPHVEGVARAEKMVLDMITACQPKDSEPFTRSHALRFTTDPLEGDLPMEHPNRCKLRDGLLYAHDQTPAWRCRKRESHDGPCSSHNDCGVMGAGRTVCGMLPGHEGPHAWATEVRVPAASAPSTTARSETPSCRCNGGSWSEKCKWPNCPKPASLTNTLADALATAVALFESEAECVKVGTDAWTWLQHANEILRLEEAVSGGTTASATPLFEEKPSAWLIVRCHGPRGGPGFTKEVVLSPLTDETFMDEGDEAWPLFRRPDGTAEAK